MHDLLCEGCFDCKPSLRCHRHSLLLRRGLRGSAFPFLSVPSVVRPSMLLIAVPGVLAGVPGGVVRRRRRIPHLAQQRPVEPDPVHEVPDRPKHGPAHRVARQ